MNPERLDTIVITPLARTLLIALLALMAAAAPASASRSQTTSFEAPADLLEPTIRPGALDEIQGLGVKHLRVVVLWKRVAPSPDARSRPAFDERDPAAYDWGQYDALMADAEARGLSVLMTLSGPVPRWATASKKDDLTRPSATRFERFVTAAGRRFGSRVATWSIWNEPNQPQFLKPQFDAKGRPASPRIYRSLYQAATKGLAAAGQGASPVLIGETSPRGTGKVVAPLTFLRGALCLNTKGRKTADCRRLKAAGVAHHAYTTREGPRFVPGGKNDVTISVLRRLTRVVDQAGRAGVLPKKLPLHLTEFGIQSAPDRIFGVSLQRQNEFRALSERIAYDNPRVASFSQYLLRDDGPREGPASQRYSGFESGLRTSGGDAKPALDGFRIVLSALRTSKSTSLWGLVRPAGGVTQVLLEYRKGSAGAWTRLGVVTTDSRGYFRRKTGTVDNRQYRALWTRPDGAVLGGAATRAVR